jgi:hypothetical protein|uniref:Uncharacterized protein n=1 Tax=Zea mays TaxID=4577 RepID=C4JC04_MAIZE|nr:unknown [Zea mays]
MDTYQSKLIRKRTSGYIYITVSEADCGPGRQPTVAGPRTLLGLLDGGLHPEQHEPDGDADEHEAVHGGGDPEDLGGVVHLGAERAAAPLPARGAERRHDLGEGVVGGLAHPEHVHLVEPLEAAVGVHALHVRDAAGPLLGRRGRQRRDRCHGERRRHPLRWVD